MDCSEDYTSMNVSLASKTFPGNSAILSAMEVQCRLTLTLAVERQSGDPWRMGEERRHRRLPLAPVMFTSSQVNNYRSKSTKKIQKRKSYDYCSLIADLDGW